MLTAVGGAVVILIVSRILWHRFGWFMAIGWVGAFLVVRLLRLTTNSN